MDAPVKYVATVHVHELCTKLYEADDIQFDKLLWKGLLEFPKRGV